jgi:hypothetical protein
MIYKNGARNALHARAALSPLHSLLRPLDDVKNMKNHRRGHSMPPRSRKLDFSEKFIFRKLKK